MAHANLPDCYDETLTGSSNCSDVLQLMANLAGQNPRAIEATCHFLTNVTCHNEAAEMDVKHVTLCFAAEVVAVNPSAGPKLAQVVCAMPDFGSPLLMAET